MTEPYRHRYRLPASLGGGEFSGLETDGTVIIDIPGTGLVPFPAAVLTRVVPNEPDDEALVILARTDGWPQDVYSRHDTAALASGQPPEFRWWWHDEKRWVPWDAIYQRGIPVRLTRAWASVGAHISAAPRGICSVCKKPTPIRTDGLVSVHGPRNRRCSGGERHPLSS